jgi:hypothetical protein
LLEQLFLCSNGSFFDSGQFMAPSGTNSVSVSALASTTPLPAALPLFASGAVCLASSAGAGKRKQHWLRDQNRNLNFGETAARRSFC